MNQFRKMDEMEMEIAIKSMRVSWIYTVVFLFVWSVYNHIKYSDPGLPCLLLITGNLVFMASQRIIKRRYK